MRRRVFLLAVCAAAIARDGLAQRPKKQFRIGVVLTTSPLVDAEVGISTAVGVTPTDRCPNPGHGHGAAQCDNQPN